MTPHIYMRGIYIYILEIGCEVYIYVLVLGASQAYRGSGSTQLVALMACDCTELSGHFGIFVFVCFFISMCHARWESAVRAICCLVGETYPWYNGRSGWAIETGRRAPK